MLGIIWDGSESVNVKEGDKYVMLRGERVEVAIEDEKQLRLSLVKKVNNRDEQIHEAVSNLRNLLERRREDLAINKRELKKITSQLNAEELDEDVEEELERQARDKRRITRLQAKEIKKLEAQTTVNVHYRIIKTGHTAVLAPGLFLWPIFLSGPVCWCPYNIPVSNEVESTTVMVEEIPLNMTSARHTTANGFGLKNCRPNEESNFIITAKDIEGKPRDVGGDKFVVESKEADMKSSVLDNKNGTYSVTYLAGDVKEHSQFSFAVTLHGCPISGSPFTISVQNLLFEVSSTDNLTNDWLDAGVVKLSNIPRAKLWVSLFDASGSEIYKSTGVTNCKWTKSKITASGRQHCDELHNAIQLDNGDCMMIIINTGYVAKGDFSIEAYRPNYIFITAGVNKSQLSGYSKPLRMIIAARAPPTIKGWTVPDNRISFAEAGFTVPSAGSWPKFNGTFRVYYTPL